MGELTTKEIIEELRKGMPTSDSSDEECERYEKAYNMAIEMLERTKPIDELVVDELENIKAEIRWIGLYNEQIECLIDNRISEWTKNW